MPPHRDEKENGGRREVLGYNGRRVGGSRRGGAAPENSGRGSGGTNTASRNRSSQGRGNSQVRGGGDSRRGVVSTGRRERDSRRPAGQDSSRGRFGRRGNNSQDRSNNDSQPRGQINGSQQQPARRQPAVDENTLRLLRSLQDRIRLLEQERSQLTSQGQAIKRFGRRVDRIVDGRPQQKQQQQIPAPRRAGEISRRPQVRRDRSPARNDRQGGNRADNSRVDRSDATRRGGVRDRNEWDDGVESRFKRRRRDADGPVRPPQPRSNQGAPQQRGNQGAPSGNFPPLRVHVRN